MGKDADRLFVEIALEKGLLTRPQVADLRKAAETLKRLRLSRSLVEIARERTILSRKQISQVRREMRKRGVLQRLGGFELISKLGEGGMGAVYEARQISLNRTVALKVLPSDLAHNREFVARFEREARLAGKISHPNVIQVHDVGEASGRHYISMEFVSGTDVKKLIDAGPVPEGRALEIVLDVARALDAAHGQEIIHRDVKPSNIMLTENGTVKLADLGLARNLDAHQTTLTRKGTLVGTPDYMSPEQCRGERDLDGRSDMYSLGATLFHMVCGRAPFVGGTTMATIHMHMNDPLPDPKAWAPELSDAAAVLIRRMTAKERDARFDSCAELIEAIEGVQNGVAPAPPLEELTAKPVGRTAADEAGQARARAAAGDGVDAQPRSPIRAGMVRRGGIPAVRIAIIAAAVTAVAIAATSVTFGWRRRPVEPVRDVPPAGRSPRAAEGPRASKPKASVVQTANPAKTEVKKKRGKEPVPARVKKRAKPALSPADRLHAALMVKNPGYRGEGRFTLREGQIVKAVLRKCGVRDLSPLRGMPLAWLDCSGNGIRDLSPLRGMELTLLECSGNPISDLSPLKDMPLKDLGISGTAVRDLSVLRGLGLRRLAFSPDRVKKDFSFLRRQRALKQIGAECEVLQARTPARVFWRQWQARAERAAVARVRAALQKETKRLDFQGVGTREAVGQLAELAGVKVSFGPGVGRAAGEKVFTMLSNKSVAAALEIILLPKGLDYDAKPQGIVIVKRSPEELAKRRLARPRERAAVPTRPPDKKPTDKARTGLHAALKAANPGYTGKGKFVVRDGEITGARLDRCKIPDLSPLQGLRLTSLSCRHNGIRDLSPLVDMPLDALFCDYNRIGDLSPLRGMRLRLLECSRNPIGDVAPLSGMPLRYLGISGLKLPHLWPLKEMPLERLAFSPEKVKGGVDFLRFHATLKFIGVNCSVRDAKTPVAEFWKRRARHKAKGRRPKRR